MDDLTLVCPFCGSPDLKPKGKHGWCECNECGEEDHAVHYGDFLTGQEDLNMIPPRYAEQ